MSQQNEKFKTTVRAVRIVNKVYQFHNLLWSHTLGKQQAYEIFLPQEMEGNLCGTDQAQHFLRGLRAKHSSALFCALSVLVCVCVCWHVMALLVSIYGR